MKLEQLKTSKFEAFKANEIQNAFQVLGGTDIATCKDNCADIYNDQSDRGDSKDYKTVVCDYSAPFA